MTTRIQHLEKRLINLKNNLKDEEKSEFRSQVYIDDLNELIYRLELDVLQLKYAENKFYEIIDDLEVGFGPYQTMGAIDD